MRKVISQIWITDSVYLPFPSSSLSFLSLSLPSFHPNKLSAKRHFAFRHLKCTESFMLFSLASVERHFYHFNYLPSQTAVPWEEQYSDRLRQYAVGSGKGGWNRGGCRPAEERMPSNYLASWIQFPHCFQRTHIEGLLNINVTPPKDRIRSQWTKAEASDQTHNHFYQFPLSPFRRRQGFQTSNQTSCEVIYSTLDVTAFLRNGDLPDVWIFLMSTVGYF